MEPQRNGWNSKGNWAGNFNKWLSYGSKTKDRPADLGNFMGYKNCETFYKKATDKNKRLPILRTSWVKKKFLGKAVTRKNLNENHGKNISPGIFYSND